MKDSISSNEKLAGIAQMEIEFTALERQKELDLLENENEIISTKLAEEKSIRIWLIAGTITLVLFSYILTIYHRSIKRTNLRLFKEIELRTTSESKLRKLKEGLEQNILERTSKLREVNLDLTKTKTEKQNSEQRLIETEKMAGIGEMAAGLAHEIRNPIAIIKSTAQYLSVNYSSTAPLVKSFIDSSDDINRIITRLMDFARMKPVEPEPLELIEFIRNCLLKFSKIIKQKEIDITEDFDQKIYSVNVDPILFEELFSNIIQNTLDVLSKQDSLSIKIRNETPYLIIEFSDNGSGIKDVEKVLKPFFTDKRNHIGLGLNFVHHIIGLHNGKLKINSKYNEGTAVRLFLPVN